MYVPVTNNFISNTQILIILFILIKTFNLVYFLPVINFTQPLDIKFGIVLRFAICIILNQKNSKVKILERDKT